MIDLKPLPPPLAPSTIPQARKRKCAEEEEEEDAEYWGESNLEGGGEKKKKKKRRRRRTKPNEAIPTLEEEDEEEEDAEMLDADVEMELSMSMGDVSMAMVEEVKNVVVREKMTPKSRTEPVPRYVSFVFSTRRDEKRTLIVLSLGFWMGFLVQTNTSRYHFCKEQDVLRSFGEESRSFGTGEEDCCWVGTGSFVFFFFLSLALALSLSFLLQHSLQTDQIPPSSSLRAGRHPLPPPTPFPTQPTHLLNTQLTNPPTHLLPHPPPIHLPPPVQPPQRLHFLPPSTQLQRSEISERAEGLYVPEGGDRGEEGEEPEAWRWRRKRRGREKSEREES